MLTLQSISSPRDQRHFLDCFDPERETWVVSDLKSKLDLQRSLLEKRDFLPGDSVVRASELWKALLTRLRPDLQMVSREFAVTILGQKLALRDEDWVRSPGAPQTAYDYMSQLMPVLAHPSGEEMMREWFEANPASEVRWGRWFSLSLDLWKEFLQEGFVAPPWVSGVLVNEPDLGLVWSRPLVFDLGAELNQVEADLIISLSTHFDITVLRPEPEWAEEYEKTLVAYQIFERKLKVTKKPAPSDEAKKSGVPPTYHKYTTMIAEVKDATALVRKWLDGKDGASAVEPTCIAIVAPDIECYWPALACYLDTEGIPCQKDQVRRLHAYPDIARWLAYLRLKTGAFAEADVEIGLFDSLGRSPRLISYERFKTLYATIYDRDDLYRVETVADRFRVELEESEESGRDDFVAWSLRQLPEEAEFQRVESLYRRLFAECPQSMRLTIQRWMAYLEQIASKVECRVRDGDPDGISCINLSSAENSPATHMIVLGLTEAALKQGGGTAVLFSDISSLAYEFGFHLASEDQAKLEFEARWITDGSERELVLTVPETDFAGGVQAASWLWVRGAKEQGSLDAITLPASTRWDEIQRSGMRRIAQERGWSAPHRLYMENSLSQDLGLMPLDAFGGEFVTRLSPSAIEDYLDCPFIFAAKRLFKLSDVAELDLEVDASRRGSLMHKLLELLTREPMRFDYSEEEYANLVDAAKTESRLELADPRLWPPLKARYTDLARRFVAFERENRKKFPETRTIGREYDIAGYLDPKTGHLHRDPHAGDLKFIGTIDRVDQDQSGHLAIMDYKSSMSSVAQFGSWLKKNQIQLLLYAMAVENGLTSLEPRPVVAALYYSVRPLNRDYGFLVEGVEQGLYEIPDKRKRNRISPEEKERLFAEGENLVRTAVGQMLEGRFEPNPRDKKDCLDCQWSALCRAPHLNS